MDSLPEAPSDPSEPVSLDRMDRRILRELQRDGNLSNQQLAAAVGLSPSPCSRRVQRLEQLGVIRGRAVLLDPVRLGLRLTVYISIRMDRHTPDRFAVFERTLADLPEVQECSMITGQDADYLVKVVVADMEHFRHLLLDCLTQVEGVSGVHSSFVLKQPVLRTGFAIED